MIDVLVFGITTAELILACSAICKHHWQRFPAFISQDVAIFIEGKEDAKITIDEIKKFCENKLAVYKIPSKVFFLSDLINLNEIPKGPTKKILRKELEKYYNLNLKE